MATWTIDPTNPAAVAPDLDIPGDVDTNSVIDQGWYIRLVDSTGAEIGEKIPASMESLPVTGRVLPTDTSSF